MMVACFFIVRFLRCFKVCLNFQVVQGGLNFFVSSGLEGCIVRIISSWFFVVFFLNKKRKKNLFIFVTNFFLKRTPKGKCRAERCLAWPDTAGTRLGPQVPDQAAGPVPAEFGFYFFCFFKFLFLFFFFKVKT